MPSIKILNGPNRNQTLYLRGGEICGRDPTSEIQIFAPGVSRRHFQFTIEGGDVVISDLSSANGTYVNNVRINKLVLNHMDMIIVGGIQLQFHADTPQVPGGMQRPAAHAETIRSNVVMRDDDDDDEAEFDYSVDASMVFTTGVTASKNVEEANEALKKRLRIIYEVSQALGTIKDSSELFQKIMAKLFEAFPQCTRGLIMVGDSINTLVPAVVHHRDGNHDAEVPVSRTIISKVYGEKQSIMLEDATEEMDNGGMSLVNLQLRTLMCVPLLYQEEVLGIIQLDTSDRSKKFSAEDLNLLTGIAGQASIFLKNASLFQQVEKEAEARTNLQRYFSPDLADKLVNGEIDLKPGGDMKTGTVFFSDIIGFTAMSQTMTPMEVINKINRYFKIMVDIIFKYRGYIDKFGGDAIMAVWGVPASFKDEALLAVTAAVEMQNALYLFNRELINEGRTDIQMGIGLNSGSFVAGNLGSEQRMEYTVIGDQVNLAQRVESKAGRGNVFISPSTYERTGKKVLVSMLQPCRVKGIDQPVPMASVRGVPTRDPTVFLMSLPFFIEGAEPPQEGLLVKAKDLGNSQILALVLMPHKVNEKTLTLRFVPQECPDFTLTFQIQREVPLQSNVGACFNGVMSIKGSMLEQLISQGIYHSDKTPDQIPRSKAYVPTS